MSNLSANYKGLFLFFIMLLSYSSVSFAQNITGSIKLDQTIILLAKKGLLDEKYNSNSNLGQKICEAGGGSMCSLVSSVGQGICEAGGGSMCSLVSSVEDGISKLPKADRDWDWDQFYGRYKNLVWACRGIQTGRFAEKERCRNKIKDDDRWPKK